MVRVFKWDGGERGKWEGGRDREEEREERESKKERERKHNDFSDIKASMWYQFVKIFL